MLGVSIGVGVNRFRAGGGFCAEYQTVYDSFTTKPSAAVSAADNIMVSTLVDAGLWSTKWEAVYMYAQDVNSDGEALKNFINPGTNDSVANSSPLFTPREGFDITDAKTITSDFNATGASKYLQDSASMGVYFRVGAADANPGLRLNETGHNAILFLPDGSVFDRIYLNSNGYVTANLDWAVGLKVASRTSSTAVKHYINEDGAGGSLASVTVANSTLLIEGPGNGTNQISCAFVGGGLTDSEQAIVQGAVNTRMTSVNRAVYPAPAFDNGKMIISFDDSKDSQYDLAYSILKTKGIEATFFTQTGVVGNSGYMTWAELLTMSNDGMDIQSHGESGTLFPSLTDEQLIAELESVNSSFTTNGLPIPQHVAYVGGSGYDVQSVRDVVYNYYKLARTVTGTGLSDRVFDRLGVRATGIDQMDATKLTEVEGLIDTAVANNQLLNVYGHGIGNGTDQIPQANFEAMIDYAINAGIDIITYSDLYTIIGE